MTIWGFGHQAYHPLVHLPFLHESLQRIVRKACTAAEIAESVTRLGKKRCVRASALTIATAHEDKDVATLS